VLGSNMKGKCERELRLWCVRNTDRVLGNVRVCYFIIGYLFWIIDPHTISGCSSRPTLLKEIKKIHPSQYLKPHTGRDIKSL
jgi:hypothetical protein